MVLEQPNTDYLFYRANVKLVERRIEQRGNGVSLWRVHGEQLEGVGILDDLPKLQFRLAGLLYCILGRRRNRLRVHPQPL